MADVDSSKLPPLTRELERRPRPGDYRPGVFLPHALARMGGGGQPRNERNRCAI